MTLPRSLIVLVLLVTTATALAAQERKISRRDLPAAVARTAATESHGAKVRGYSTEKENGQTMYEVELTVHGHHRDVLIDTTGAVVEVERQVKPAAVPAVVRNSWRAAAGKGRVTGVKWSRRAGGSSPTK